MIASYKPPNENNELFLDYLETRFSSINPREDVLVVGDLNLDWLSIKGRILRDFCSRNSLSNAITCATRIARVERSGRTLETTSLIDVALQNNSNTVHTSKVIDFPFSDHSLVALQLNFNRIAITCDVRLFRNINKNILESIVKTVKSLDLTILDSINDINARWQWFKRIILNIVDAIAPLKTPKKHKHDCVPWYDEELLENRRSVSALFKA